MRYYDRMTEGDAAATETPAAPVVTPVESASTAPATSKEETPAAASPPPSSPAPELPEPAPELPPIETPTPEIPQPSPAPQPTQPTNPTATAPITIKDRLYAALEKIQFRKRAKLNKILLLAAKKRSIKNDDVEKLLKVSDATASRYLRQLVQEGRLRRSGMTSSIVYELV